MQRTKATIKRALGDITAGDSEAGRRRTKWRASVPASRARRKLRKKSRNPGVRWSRHRSTLRSLLR